MNEVDEREEREHLERTKATLAEALAQLDRRVVDYDTQRREQAAHMWEHRRDMDHIEKAVAHQTTQQIVATGDAVAATRNRVQKLLASPYFGRFDFRKTGDEGSRAVYVGVHAFGAPDGDAPLVYDWRAPISSMFYDYELGDAAYPSPRGPVHGNIALKRQFRIRRGHLELMLESGLNILDDVLQEELSQTSDERMKTIVATIQRDQNAIIRNEDAETLIIQGVAGSGKTSIALHRIAFLLYRHRDTLTSQDILIVSPNKVFADFISNVLPELGEEHIPEIEIEKLARELLDPSIRFQTLSEQTTALLETRDEALQRRIEDKASLAFLEKLEAYAAHVEATRFRAEDVTVGGRTVRAPLVEQMYRKRPDLRPAERLSWVADSIGQHLRRTFRHELTARERTELRKRVKKMYTSATLRRTYQAFFDWLGRPELLVPHRRSELEYSDVFPMIYLGLRLEGVEIVRRRIEHLVIDEMQDYTPVQYAVISKLFACNKTILGDTNQAVHASTATTADTISRIFKHAECVKLCTSYRSSYEITRFAQGIAPDAELVAIERRGELPVVAAHAAHSDEVRAIVDAIAAFRARGSRTMGIICKSPAQAATLHEALVASDPSVQLLSERSTSFVLGAVVCAAHLAKGLEFDDVVVPHATDENYASALERNLLYVACTRAMHRLTVTHTGAATRFLPAAALYERR